MDYWRFDGVPLSTTTTTAPKAATVLSLSSPAAGIRAPLTLLDESDFEYSVSPKSSRNSTASSYYSSDGSVSGDGEQEQEEDYNDDPGEEIVQETHFVKEYEFPRPVVKTPHEDMVQESKSGLNGREIIADGSSSSSSSISSVSGNGFSRPFITSVVSSDSSEYTDSDEESVVEDGGDVEHGDSSSRPLEDVITEEVVEKEPASEVSLGVSLGPISLRPVAMISGESDDDDDSGSRRSEGMEDDGFSGFVVRVPSIDVLTRITDSPKVKSLDVGGGEDDELGGESAAERMIVEANEEIASVEEPERPQVGVMELEVAESESSSGCPDVLEFPECLTQTKKLDGMFDRPEGTDMSVLCHETNREAEDDELLLMEVGNLTLPTKFVAAEVENEEIFISQSGGEKLHDSLEAIDAESVLDLEGKVDADGGRNDGRDTTDSSVIKLSPLEIDYSVPVSEARSPVLLAPSTPNVELEQPLSEREHGKILEQMPHLRFLHRLSSSADGSLAAELTEEKSLSEELTLTSAETSAMELEVQRKGDFDSSLSILVIGKTGVGKSATINSIFRERKTVTDAFKPATTVVKEIFGMIDGVNIKILDTPGLRTSLGDQSINRKMLLSIKKHIQKSPPDVVLYLDRLDMQTSEIIDLPLIRSISTYLGSWIWHRTVIVLTHAKSLPPDGPDGTPLSHDSFVAQRLHVLRQLISRSTVDQHLTTNGAMVPVSLVENHPLDTTNHHGESSESPLLFLCHSMKILSELDSVAVTGSSLNRFVRWGCNLPTVFKVDADTKQRIWAELNKQLSGQMSIETGRSYQVQLASLGLVAIANAILYRIFT